MENSWQNPKMRRMVWIVAALFVVVVVIGQVAKTSTSKPPAMPQLAADISPDVHERLTQAWPKVLTACPGLAKYYRELRFERIDMAFPDPTGAYHANFVFSVSDGKSSIPTEFMAFGQTCYFGVSSDGAGLLVPKSGCQSLCLDRVVPHAGNDLTLPLR
ncbi:hypothetical protein [Desulfovibrio psychrotolerans]|uniref:Uncharacterized protein n=1 Tax=Desulfovibrio psychrotolerans TaxID=415242 RepID=A0A7J0BVF2_9BACT|nr:hypothetical protein [Desulfovibrio psychrotolerans]GFM37697.1 hypothetical protein DSM19430T_23810 [Desulfovibrio psychrotolerans]